MMFGGRWGLVVWREMGSKGREEGKDAEESVDVVWGFLKTIPIYVSVLPSALFFDSTSADTPARVRTASGGLQPRK